MEKNEKYFENFIRLKRFLKAFAQLTTAYCAKMKSARLTTTIGKHLTILCDVIFWKILNKAQSKTKKIIDDKNHDENCDHKLYRFNSLTHSV
jgi:hypothetical protein